MIMDIIKGNFTIEKMEGKGGWSFVLLPYAFDKSDLPFGWIVVKGTIDDYPIKQYKLWPTKYGELFLPIKSEIRKKIRKGVGDIITVEIYKDDSSYDIPDEFTSCLQDSPTALSYFNSISETSKKQYVDWIYASKSNGTKIERITKAIEKLALGKKYHEQ
jgi:hypothetical protein